MKSIIRYLLIVVLGGGAMVFADGGLVCPTCGQPPNGIGIDGKAQGTKLDGVIFIEFYNKVLVDPTAGLVEADGRFVLRLKKGSEFEMFYTEAFVDDTSDPANVQDVITNNLQSEVLQRFFGRTDLIIKLKNIEQFGSKAFVTTDPSLNSTFILANIQLAVQ